MIVDATGTLRPKERTSVKHRAQLTYAFDAYCGWCYGFGPAVHAFAAANAERIELRVLSGGLFTGPQALPVAAFPFIVSANARITDLTGASFGDGYARTLADGAAVMNSVDAAAGLIALRRQDNVRLLDATQAIQRAWYIDGRSLSDVQVYRDVADAQGLDAAAVAAAYTDASTRAEVEADFHEVRRLGVEAYPTLLLHSADETFRLGGPASSAQALTRALDEHLARSTA